MTIHMSLVRDILVTTPKTQVLHAAREAQTCIGQGGGIYFRRLPLRPELVKPKLSKVFYVEDGFVRGYGIMDAIEWHKTMTDEVSGKTWKAGFYMLIEAKTWTWIRPIPHIGFQGFRYFQGQEYEVVGDWLDPMPVTGAK